MAPSDSDSDSDAASDSDHDDHWLDGCPGRLRGPLQRCARGDSPVNVAAMQLLAEAVDAPEVEAVLSGAALASARRGEAEAQARLESALALVRANPQAFATVKAILGGMEHGGTANTPEEGVARWAAAFDAAARTSPEGSVALYALGNPDLLQAATAEVVDALRAAGLLGPDRSVLEIGCGIGRFQAALAPEVASVVGIDISGAMIAAARERCAGLANVRLLQCSGRDLADFADASFDLVLAVDSFPYLVQSGMALAALHVRESARVLRPGGALLILNFSYRGDLDADRADVARLGAKAGLGMLREGAPRFRYWDGVLFHLAKSAAQPGPGR